MKQTSSKLFSAALAFCMAFSMVTFADLGWNVATAKAAEGKVMVSNYQELLAALAANEVNHIVVTDDIDVPCGTAPNGIGASDKTTAQLVIDRSLVLEGSSRDVTIKRTAGEGATKTNLRSLFEICGNEVVDGVEVTLKYITIDGGAEVIPEEAKYSGLAGRSIIDVYNTATLNIENATIQNGATTNSIATHATDTGSRAYGGAVRVDYKGDKGGTINVKAGALIQNCYAENGGALACYNNGKLNVYGGVITNCCATDGGGAIYLSYRYGTTATTVGTVKMYGGEISNCYAKNGRGGAIWIWDGIGTDYILGGTITNCHAKVDGGAISLYNTEGGNLYMPLPGGPLTITDCTPSASATGFEDYTGVSYSGQNERTKLTVFGEAVNVNFYTGKDELLCSLQVVQNTAAGEAFAGDPVKKGKEFIGWYQKGDENKELVTKDTIITDNMDLYALWCHDFVFASDGTTIIATCQSGDKCSLMDPEVYLPLDIEDTVYTGEPIWAHIGQYEAEEWLRIIGGEIPQITYYDVKNDCPLDGAPIEVGDYTASIEYKGAVASLDFSILCDEHEWDEGVVESEATCDCEGEMMYTCLKCGEVDYEEIPMLEEHSWNSGAITKYPTCMAEGEKTYSCIVCGKTEKKTLDKLSTHSWDDGKITKNATCGATGVKTYTCNVCKTAKNEILPKLVTHSYDAGKITTAPTCTAEGVKTYNCLVCKNTKTEKIPAKGHAYATVQFVWTGYSACKATFTCANDSTHVVDVTCKITSKVTKEPTTEAEGTKEYTATATFNGKNYTDKKTEKLPKLEKEDPDDGNGDDNGGNNDDDSDYDGAPDSSHEDPVITNRINLGFKIYEKGRKIYVAWSTSKQVDGYEVYATYCGKGKKLQKVKTLKGSSAKSAVITKLNGKKIDPKKQAKVLVAAYKKVKGKKQYIGKTIIGHIVGSKSTKYTDAKKITISKTSFTLNKGKTAQIKAKTVKNNKKLKILKHVAEFRYVSSDKKIATVSASGKIKALKKGKCTIFVYAVNGYCKKVTVKVK